MHGIKSRLCNSVLLNTVNMTTQYSITNFRVLPSDLQLFARSIVWEHCEEQVEKVQQLFVEYCRALVVI